MSLKMNGSEVDVFEGEVVSQNRHHETHVTGGIHNKWGVLQGDPIKSETVTSDELYLRLKDGSEMAISTNGHFSFSL